MRYIFKPPARHSQVRTVLAVQGEMAYWFKIESEHVVASYVEVIPLEGESYKMQCPWVTCNDVLDPCFIELILDTSLDEVDRVGVERSQLGMVNRYRKTMTLSRLHKDYAEASIFEVPVGEQEYIASVMHHTIPERWAFWLLQLQEECSVVFHRAATGSQLAARWSRHWSELKLLVMAVSDYERHMLVQEGCVLFLRTVPAARQVEPSLIKNPVDVRTSLDQSMSYLCSNLAIEAASVDIIKPGFNELRVCDERGIHAEHAGVDLKAVDRLQDHSDSSVVDSVAVLVAMWLGKSEHIDIERIGTSVSETQEPSFDFRSGDHMKKSSLTGFPKGLLGINGRPSTGKVWSLRSSALGKLSALEPSLQYVNTAYRLVLVQRLAIGFLLMAAVSLLAASVSGVTAHQLIQANRVKQSAISAAESDIYQRAAALVSRPRIAADTLFMADSLSSLPFARPDRLLDTIATVVTRVPAIELDRIIWAKVAASNAYESLTHSLGSVPYRQSGDARAGEDSVQLELSGRISGTTLNEQQRVLSAFVGELQKIPHAKQTRVLESPVDSALSSESARDSLGRYRIAVFLGGQ